MHFVVLVTALCSLLLGADAKVRERIINADYRAAQERGSATGTTDAPSPWVKTLADGKKSIVTPTVIASVTFYAKPTKTHDGLEPWISLKKDGLPATIRPQIKNGVTKNGQPDYGTYFASPTTILHEHNDLVAHDLAPGEVFEEVKWINDEDSEHELDPLIRCTPDGYHKKGMGKDVSSEPFCFPRDELELKLDKSYFVTWYSRFFDLSVEKVKLHISYVKQAPLRKGYKRDVANSLESSNGDSYPEEGLEIQDTKKFSNEAAARTPEKRSLELEKGGKISGDSFFESDWILNNKGWMSFTIEDSWFPEGSFMEKVAFSLQPDNVSDEDFDRLANTVVVGITKRSKVTKGSMMDLKKVTEALANEGDEFEVEEGINYEGYIVMMTMPLCVCVFGLLMYIFIRANKGMTDLSHLKRHRLARRLGGSDKARHGEGLPRYFSESAKSD